MWSGLVKTLKNSINSELIVRNSKDINQAGIDYGDALVVSFRNNVDLIGFSLSIASKITALESANIVLIGQCILEQISLTEGFTKRFYPSDYQGL